MRKCKFKVVDKSRGSCIVNVNSSFYIKYPPGKNVYARKDSLGIMVFNTRETAEAFIDIHSFNRYGINNSKNWKIKRVIPIGKGKTPEYISKSARTKDIKELVNLMKKNIKGGNLRNNMFFKLCTPIGNTICYPGVHVVD